MLLFAFLPLVLAATFTRPLERVSSLDPAQARSLYDTHAVGLLYEMPLAIDYKARPYRVIPGFFELPDVSSDGLVYTLRRARPESDALTALDAARSLERLRDPKAVSPNGWILKDVGAISAPDAQTLVITLRRRCHFFPWLLTMPATAVCGPHGEGTGPYRLAAWRKNHEMVFARRGRGIRIWDMVGSKRGGGEGRQQSSSTRGGGFGHGSSIWERRGHCAGRKCK